MANTTTTGQQTPWGAVDDRRTRLGLDATRGTPTALIRTPPPTLRNGGRLTNRPGAPDPRRINPDTNLTGSSVALLTSPTKTPRAPLVQSGKRPPEFYPAFQQTNLLTTVLGLIPSPVQNTPWVRVERLPDIQVTPVGGPRTIFSTDPALPVGQAMLQTLERQRDVANTTLSSPAPLLVPIQAPLNTQLYLQVERPRDYFAVSSGMFVGLRGGPVGNTLTGSAGTYAIAGQAAALNVGRLLSGAAGSYALTGQNATGLVGRKLSGTTGSYSISGQAGSLNAGRLLSGSAGSYSLTGIAATLTYRAGNSPVAYSLSGSPGAYSINGGSATFTRTGTDPFIQVISGYIAKRKAKLDEEKQRADDLARQLTEQAQAAPVRKPKTIPLAQLVGTVAAAQIQGQPGELIEKAYQAQSERTAAEKAVQQAKAKARRRADDEAILMMF